MIIRRVLALTLVLLAAGAATASAAARGPSYAADPPTAGAWYRDGQSGRYLLGGTLAVSRRPGRRRLAQGWWRDVAATDGWSPVTVPNAYNAGDFSSASMNGSVGWYRRDFTLPAARLRTATWPRPTATGSSASSRSTTAPRCG